jgi:hypothetical protein
MTSDRDTGAVAAFCPYCGGALGSFFGTRTADGDRVCERCGECFRVTRVPIDDNQDPDQIAAGATKEPD